MAGTAAQPYMLLGTVDSLGLSSYVTAIDLTTRKPAWTVNINPTWGPDQSSGQFPIVISAAGKPVVVATGYYGGPYFIAEP